MNRLDDLPLAQKIMIVVLSLALVAAAGYFLLIGDVQDTISAKQSEVRRLQAESDALNPYKRKDALDELVEQENKELARIEQNRKMLPTREELPAFVDSVKADADAVGLQLTKFEVMETELEDYYAAIPIRMTTVGTFPKFVAFLRTLAAANKRISNVRELKIRRMVPDIKQILGLMGDNDTSRKLKELVRERNSAHPEFDALIRILEMEAVHSLGLMEASFTVYAYSYTGKPAPEDKKKRKRRRSR